MKSTLLLSHDFLIVREILRSLLTNVVDIFVIIFLGAIVISLAGRSISSVEPAYQTLIASCLPTLPAMALDIFARRRLTYFRTDSLLVTTALNQRNAIYYWSTLHIVASLLLSMVLFFPNLGLVAHSFGAWWLSIMLIQIVLQAIRFFQLRISPRKSMAFGNILDSRYVAKGRAVVCAVGFAIIVTTSLLLDELSASAVAAIITISALLWFSPISYGIVDFERILGWAPLTSVWSNLRGLTWLGLVFIGAAVLGMNWQVIAAIITVVFIVLAYKTLEVLLARVVNRNQVQFAIATALFTIFSVAPIIPWIIPVLFVLLVVWLVCKGNKRLWLLA